MKTNKFKKYTKGQPGKLDKPRFIRCLAIYRRLSHAPAHIERLARNYKVSVRSIQRDLNALTQAGYPVMPGSGKGWYGMDPVLRGG